MRSWVPWRNLSIFGIELKHLVIDPLALRSSQKSLVKFYVSNFDFGLQKDFNFLNGFNKLDRLINYHLQQQYLHRFLVLLVIAAFTVLFVNKELSRNQSNRVPWLKPRQNKDIIIEIQGNKWSKGRWNCGQVGRIDFCRFVRKVGSK